MGRILAHWVLSALCLLLVAHFVPGFVVSGFGTALIAAVVIGLVNGTLGMLLKIITFPLTILSFGVFWLLINALMLKVAAALVPGFTLVGLWPADRTEERARRIKVRRLGREEPRLQLLNKLLFLLRSFDLGKPVEVRVCAQLSRQRALGAQKQESQLL